MNVEANTTVSIVAFFSTWNLFTNDSQNLFVSVPVLVLYDVYLLLNLNCCVTLLVIFTD